MKGFSRRLTKLMEELGVANLKQLEKITKDNPKPYRLPSSTVHDWVTDDFVNLKNARRIGKALNNFRVNWEWILTGEGLMILESNQEAPQPSTQKKAHDFDVIRRFKTRMLLIKNTFGYFEWEIDLATKTFTFQKRTIDKSAHLDETLSMPLDNLFDHIHEDDHDRVYASIRKIIHDLDNNIHNLTYRLITKNGLELRESQIICEFDDYTIPVCIYGISGPASTSNNIIRKKQMELEISETS